MRVFATDSTREFRYQCFNRLRPFNYPPRLPNDFTVCAVLLNNANITNLLFICRLMLYHNVWPVWCRNWPRFSARSRDRQHHHVQVGPLAAPGRGDMDNHAHCAKRWPMAILPRSLRMADRALLAGYPRNVQRIWNRIILVLIRCYQLQVGAAFLEEYAAKHVRWRHNDRQAEKLCRRHTPT